MFEVHIYVQHFQTHSHLHTPAGSYSCILSRSLSIIFAAWTNDETKQNSTNKPTQQVYHKSSCDRAAWKSEHKREHVVPIGSAHRLHSVEWVNYNVTGAFSHIESWVADRSCLSKRICNETTAIFQWEQRQLSHWTTYSVKAGRQGSSPHLPTTTKAFWSDTSLKYKYSYLNRNSLRAASFLPAKT